MIPSPTEEILAETTVTTGAVITWSLVVFYLIKIVLKKSLRALWDTIDAIQLIYFLRYCNVLLPYMLKDIIDVFN